MIKGVTIEKNNRITFIPDSAIAKCSVCEAMGSYYLSVWTLADREGEYILKGSADEITAAVSGSDFHSEIFRMIANLNRPAQNSKREPVHHDLKCEQPHFENAWEKRKPFEIRKDDRDYQEGDTFTLNEFDADSSIYSGRYLRGTIPLVLRHDDYPEGITEGYVVMTIKPTVWGGDC